MGNDTSQPCGSFSARVGTASQGCRGRRFPLCQQGVRHSRDGKRGQGRRWPDRRDRPHVARHVLLVVAGMLEVPAANLAVIHRAGGGVGAADLVRHRRPEDIAQVRIGAREVGRGCRRCRHEGRGRWRRRVRNCGGSRHRLARCAVLRVDDGGVDVVRGSEVTGVVGGGHAPGLPLMLTQVLLKVAGMGVGRSTELASVDGGGGICKDSCSFRYPFPCGINHRSSIGNLSLLL